MQKTVLTAKQQQGTAQLFIGCSCLAMLLLPLVIPTVLWIAASIVVYAMNSSHPNQQVRHIVQRFSYCFYGVVGILTVFLAFFASVIISIIGGLTLFFIVWGTAILLIIPYGILSSLQLKKINWQDLTLE